MADNGKKAKKIYSILTYIYLVGFLGFLLLGPSPYYVKCGRRSYRDKACYSNIRVITGAVEMYNMDHETFMENLDEDLLVKDGYLKTKLIYKQNKIIRKIVQKRSWWASNRSTLNYS